jgi:hypothetical protein
MKKILFLFVVGVATLNVEAQKKPILNPTYEFGYFVQGDGGANGLTVTYHPDKGYYYCVQAGNADFPLEVFTSTGESVYTTTAKVDTRGFWYNAKTKCFEGTMYTGGTFKAYVDANGYPTNPVMQGNSASFIPPVEQSQVVCNVAKGEMYAYNDSYIYVYNQKTNKLKKKIQIKNSPVVADYINPFAMIYTGYKNYEFGLYDIVSYRLLLFNSKGVFTQAVQMPYDVPAIELFRLGFANDRLFLYDGDYRAWYAYKIF